MRIALLPDGLVTVDRGLRIERAQRSFAVSTGEADPYAPVGPLAVDPSGRRAWVRANDGRANRVNLDTGEIEAFDFELRDAVYDPSGLLFAAIGAPSDDLRLVELSDDTPLVHREISLPDPRRIHWPYSPPYRSAVYDLDWHGALRLSATRWGVALAHVNGTLWARFSDGHQRAWRMPPVYQGWTCAYPHQDGLVVTSMHNGRTGEIVWLDREGVWHDAYDSRWSAVGPCVPTCRGFLAPIDDELVRFEGFPATITQLASVGGSPTDTAVDLALERVVIDYGDCRAVLNATDDAVTVRIGREDSREAFEHTAEPGPKQPWIFEPIDDPDLGRIWRPDRDRVTQLLTSLRALHAVDPNAAATALQQATRSASVEPASDPDALEATVWRSLRRWVTEPLPHASLQRVSERLDSLDDDPFLEHALRSALSAPGAAELLSRPPPLPAVIKMLDALVTDELLELTHPADESLQFAIDAVVRGASSIEAAAEALEELLFEHDAVEELHAEREELERHVAAAWAASRE